MRLPFSLPPKLQAFSQEFMSAFDAEADHSLPISIQHDIQTSSDAEAATVHTCTPVSQTKSIAAAASETASLIASSLRALVPMASSDSQRLAHDPAPGNTASPPFDAAGHLDPLLQDAVDRELEGFGRYSASSALPSVIGDVLRRNYMRLSLALLILGLILLFML
jgi:hypothetical protein